MRGGLVIFFFCSKCMWSTEISVYHLKLDFLLFQLDSRPIGEHVQMKHKKMTGLNHFQHCTPRLTLCNRNIVLYGLQSGACFHCLAHIQLLATQNRHPIHHRSVHAIKWTHQSNELKYMKQHLWAWKFTYRLIVSCLWHQTVTKAKSANCSDFCPLKMPAIGTGETLGRKTLRTWPNSLENPQQPSDPSRESLREYNANCAHSVLIFCSAYRFYWT